MEQRILLIENLINALQGKVDQVAGQLSEQIANQGKTEASHQQVHKKVAELRNLSAEVESLKDSLKASKAHGSHPSQDKTIMPESYS